MGVPIRHLKIVVFLSFMLVLVQAFQNCGRSRERVPEAILAANRLKIKVDCLASPQDPGCGLSSRAPEVCRFNGQELSEAQTVTAYLNSSVKSGDVCSAETRTCLSGQLTGRFAFAGCTVNAPESCLFDGKTLKSGEKIQAFQNSTTPFGENCVAEERSCDNGELSGTYAYANCQPAAPADCLFNAETINHGQSIQAFVSSSVAYGAICEAQTRTCSNGSLLGSAAYASCVAGQPASCLFNGQTIAHGQKVIAFLNSTVPASKTCESEERLCQNGELTGRFGASSCAVDAPISCEFNGQTLVHGQSVTAFLNSTAAAGDNCQYQTRSCNDGQLSGGYTYASCQVEAPAVLCLFDGQTLASGQVVTAYQNSSVNFKEKCIEEKRACQNGELSGQFNFSSCQVGTPKSCRFNGETIVHGQVIKAFQTSNVGYGEECHSEQRICDDGELSGSFAMGSCQVGEPAACLFNGSTVAHGQELTAYLSSSVGYDQTCTTEKRVCQNGALSGSFTSPTCQVDAPKSCLFNGRSVASGEQVMAFLNSSAAFGQSCESQVRICQNGQLSGQFGFSSCDVNAPKSCQFNRVDLAHGQPVVAFQSSTVGYGSVCVSEERLCNDGLLSGSATFANCGVQAPESCLFNGQSIAHGSNVYAYRNSAVAFGQACEAEMRVCENGQLSGQSSFASCAVSAPKSCLLNGQTIPHGQIVNAFEVAEATTSEGCKSQERVCKDGELTGSFENLSCAVKPLESGCIASVISNNHTANIIPTAVSWYGDSKTYGACYTFPNQTGIIYSAEEQAKIEISSVKQPIPQKVSVLSGGVLTFKQRAVNGTSLHQLFEGKDGVNLPWDQQVLSDSSPIFVIGHGTNDVSRDIRLGRTVNDFKLTLLQVIQTAVNAGKKVILMEPYKICSYNELIPSGEGHTSQQADNLMKPYVDAINEVAASQGLPVIKLFHLPVTCPFIPPLVQTVPAYSRAQNPMTFDLSKDLPDYIHANQKFIDRISGIAVDVVLKVYRKD